MGTKASLAAPEPLASPPVQPYDLTNEGGGCTGGVTPREAAFAEHGENAHVLQKLPPWVPHSQKQKRQRQLVHDVGANVVQHCHGPSVLVTEGLRA